MELRAGARVVTTVSHASALAAVPRIELLGIPLHAITEAECVRLVHAELDAGRGGWVTTPNLDHLRRLVRDADFRALCAPSSLAVADGAPLVLASKLQRTPLPARVAGSDLISSLSAATAVHGRSVYLLGGDPGTAEGAARVLVARHPTLRIAGTSCPEPGFDKDPARLHAIVEELVRAKPDIVYVALGSPKQEKLIATLMPALPGAWWLGIGISFSFLTGDVRRAPQWMRSAGLEWMHRLGQEPRRLARRYLVDGLPFAAVLFARTAWRGVTQRGL